MSNPKDKKKQNRNESASEARVTSFDALGEQQQQDTLDDEFEDELYCVLDEECDDFDLY